MWHACDLHIHTSFSSDADIAPEDVAAAARRRGLSLLAITDHHDVRGWRPARAAARGTGVAVIPGVELTCPDGASAVHVLGIFGLKGFDENRVIEALGLVEAGLGSAEGAVDYGVAEATQRIHALGGLAIAAHAKGPKGLLKECSSHALARVMAEAEFDAIEIPAAGDPWRKTGLPASVAALPIVSGSDAHHAEDRPGDSTRPYGIGARPCWIYTGQRLPGFPTLCFALSPPHEDYVHVLNPMLTWKGKRRVDALLHLREPWLRVVTDDRGAAHLREIRQAVVDLLNADGGHVLVGARRRWENRATRGADLQYSGDELLDLVAEAITPAPLLRAASYRVTKGTMVEIVVLGAENPAKPYALMPRAQGTERIRGQRAALQRLELFDARPLERRLAERASNGPLSLAELAALAPQRAWFDGHAALTNLLAQALAHHLLTTDDPPRWLIQWAREMPRARLETTTGFRELAKRDIGRDHRERLREAMATRLRNVKDRRAVERFMETAHSRMQRGAAAFDEPMTDAARARKRACRAFGDSIGTTLDAEREKAAAQYTAAIKDAFGAVAEPVIQIGGTANAALNMNALEAAGVTKLILAGAGAATGDFALTVPDPLAEATAPEILKRWAAPDALDPGQSRLLIRRAVESGAHLPVLRFAAEVGRDGLEQLITELEQQRVGGLQIRNLTIADLRRCLQPPEGPGTAGDAERVAQQAIAELENGCDADVLKDAATAAIAAPLAAAATLAERPGVAVEVRAAADPDQPQQIRRFAVVLAACAGEIPIDEWWEDSTIHQVRIGLVQAADMSAAIHGTDLGELFEEALESKGQVAREAARALATRGADGYQRLRGLLPVDPNRRANVLRGIVEAANQHPDEARALAVAAVDQPAASLYSALRDLDERLHLRRAQEACAGVASLEARRARRVRGRRDTAGSAPGA